MIVVDASAIIAILFDEADGPAFRRLVEARGGLISPINHWEVLARAFGRMGDPGVDEALALLEALDVEVATITVADSRSAFAAFRRYGRSTGGPLNLGDCFAYALAQIEGDGLLYKGADFPQTDVISALP